MNKIRYYFSAVILVSFVLLFVSCKKEDGVLSLQRPFTPAAIATANGEKSAVVIWPASLFSTTGSVEYKIDVSKTTDFATIDYTKTTKFLGDTINNTTLIIRQTYYARVKVLGKNGQTDSNYIVSGAFRITGEQFLLPVTTTNLTDVAVQLYWKVPNPDLVKITLQLSAGGPIVDYPLSPSEVTAGVKVISGLTPATNYTAEIFTATQYKGTATFKTLASISGNIIDISGTASDILQTTITGAADGSVIVLRRGQTYTITANHTKSLMFRSKLDFGTDYAEIRQAVGIGAANSFDSLVFRDVKLRGGKPSRGSYDADYVLNMASGSLVSPVVINKVRLENCLVHIFRGIVRENIAGARINSYFVNNCVIDSVKDFSVAQVSVGTGFGTIRFTNSTIYKSRKLITHAIAGSTCTSVLIENCTFNEAPGFNGTNYLIDFNGITITNGIILRNCLFGQNWADVAGTSNGYRGPTPLTVTSCYATTDFVLTTDAIAMSSYAGTASSLYTDPLNGNFKIKDANFVGRNTTGDPRWRIP